MGQGNRKQPGYSDNNEFFFDEYSVDLQHPGVEHSIFEDALNRLTQKASRRGKSMRLPKKAERWH